MATTACLSYGLGKAAKKYLTYTRLWHESQKHYTTIFLPDLHTFIFHLST